MQIRGTTLLMILVKVTPQRIIAQTYNGVHRCEYPQYGLPNIYSKVIRHTFTHEAFTIPHSLGATLHDRLYQRINIYRCQLQVQLYTICRVVAIGLNAFLYAHNKRYIL